MLKKRFTYEELDTGRKMYQAFLDGVGRNPLTEWDEDRVSGKLTLVALNRMRYVMWYFICMHDMRVLTNPDIDDRGVIDNTWKSIVEKPQFIISYAPAVLPPVPEIYDELAIGDPLPIIEN